MSPENERALIFFTHRALYYAREGKVTCGTCGATPYDYDVFSPRMSCGHEWSTLVWTRNKQAEPGNRQAEVTDDSSKDGGAT